MPIPSINFSSIPVQKPDYSGFENLTKNFLESYHAPQRLKEERAAAKRLKEAEELAHYFKQTYGPRRNEAEIKYLEGQADREATGLTPVAQDLLKAFGGQTPEFNEFVKNYYNPQSYGSRGSEKQYAPSYQAKILNEIQDAKDGFRPGTNRTEILPPEEQEETINRLELASQKHSTDVTLRQRAINASNVEKAFKNTNLDDLVAYSGLKGATELKKEQLLDTFGKSSEKYKKYKEAVTKSQLEAKEIRQLFGDSITPEVNEQLKLLLNPTGLSTSPETAKRQVEAARHIIIKQLDTFRKGLQRKSEYIGEYGAGIAPGENERAFNNLNPDVVNSPIGENRASQLTTEQLIEMRRNAS